MQGDQPAFSDWEESVLGRIASLALRTRMPATRVGQILHGRRSVSTDTALRLARCFNTSAEFWLNLQTAHDLSKARLELDSIIQRDVEPLHLEAV